MKLKSRILFACFLVVAAIGGFKELKTGTSAPPTPVVLTIMGRVADIGESTERQAFRQFSAGSGVQMRFAQSLQTANERVDLYRNLFANHSPTLDLIDLDVIWPATLGEYLVDLKPLFSGQLADFSPELLQNFTVNGRLIAIPTFVDAGVLYYRSDLLKKYGYRTPPKTWVELETMAARIQAGERRSGKPDFWGYVWQGGAYESLTCNALEWQSSSGGGAILGPDRTVRVRNPQFVQMLKRVVSWIGVISPPGQSAFGEQDSLNFWLAGKAAFMRNWTGEYMGVIRSPTPVREHTALAALPGGEGGARGTLGGAGTGISLYSAHRDEALRALKAIISEPTQRDRAVTGGSIPSRQSLLTQSDIMAHTPLHNGVADQVLRNLVARPALKSGLKYNLVTQAYYTSIHSILTRQVTPEEGLALLEAELVKITGFKAVP